MRAVRRATALNDANCNRDSLIDAYAEGARLADELDGNTAAGEVVFSEHNLIVARQPVLGRRIGARRREIGPRSLSPFGSIARAEKAGLRMRAAVPALAFNHNLERAIMRLLDCGARPWIGSCCQKKVGGCGRAANNASPRHGSARIA